MWIHRVRVERTVSLTPVERLSRGGPNLPPVRLARPGADCDANCTPIDACGTHKDLADMALRFFFCHRALWYDSAWS